MKRAKKQIFFYLFVKIVIFAATNHFYPSSMNGQHTSQLFPLMRVAVALIAGMVAAFEWGGGVAAWVWLAALCVAAVATALTGRQATAQGAAILTAVFCLGAFLMTRQREALSAALPEGPRNYEAIIVSEPRERGKVMQMDLRIVSGSMQGRQVKAALLKDTVARRYEHLHLGDGIVATSVFEQPKRFGDTHFDYPLYLRCQGFTATTFIFYRHWRKAEVSMASLGRLERTRLEALKFRQGLIDRYAQLGMARDELAVALAMTLGDKSHLTRSQRDLYSISGASHVLALSGLHIGIIYMLMVVLVGYRRWRVLRETLLILGIWAYAFLTGLSPSVTRAATMLTIYSVVSLLGRDRMSLNTLALTAILMLAFNPLSLYDIGFQLSFLAVLSILLLYQPLFGLIPARVLDCVGWGGIYPLRWAWAMVVVSVCAQIGTAPLTMYVFGRFSVYFLLTNFVVIPLAYAILLLTALLFALSLWPAVQIWLAGALSAVVGWQNGAVGWISSLPGSHIEGIVLSRWHVWAIYALFLLLAWWLRRVHR